MKTKIYIAISILITICFLSGCDPITRHRALSTVFEGVPDYPPPEQMCTDYAEKRLAEYKNELSGKDTAAKSASTTESVHSPYEEKKCDDCHDRSKEGGFSSPLKQLCFKCHTDLVKGPYVHGPVAVGDCLTCHVPHNSSIAPLLKKSVNELCADCHRQKRMAASLHDKFSRREIACTECHNPHSGNAQYFLE